MEACLASSNWVIFCSLSLSANSPIEAPFFNHIDKQPYCRHGRNGLWSNHIYSFGWETQDKPSPEHVGSCYTGSRTKELVEFFRDQATTNFSSMYWERCYRGKTWLPSVEDPCCLPIPWTEEGSVLQRGCCSGHRGKYPSRQPGQRGSAPSSWHPGDLDES